MRKTEKEKLINLLEELVGAVLNQDEMGGCVWCGGIARPGYCKGYGYCNEDYECHQPDCPWVAGDKYLTELKS